MRKLLLVVALASFPAALVSCHQATVTSAPVPPRDPYLIVARSINDIQQSNRELARSVIQANQKHLVSDANARTILDVSLSVSQGGDQAAAALTGLTTLPPSTKVTIWTAMRPLLAVVNDMIQTGLVQISDQQTKTAVQTLLLSIQGALAIVQVQTGGQ